MSGLGEIHVSYEGTQSDSINGPVDLRVICFVIGALALFAPILASLELVFSRSATIMAMTWMYGRIYLDAAFGFVEPWQLVALLPFTIWRLGFVYQMYRYYSARSTRDMTVFLGVLTEMPLPLISSVSILFGYSSALVTYVTIPTPFMLAGALIFLWLTPPPNTKTEVDNQGWSDRWREDHGLDTSYRMKCPQCGNKQIVTEMYPGTSGVRAGVFNSCGICGTRWEG